MTAKVKPQKNLIVFNYTR